MLGEVAVDGGVIALVLCVLIQEGDHLLSRDIHIRPEGRGRGSRGDAGKICPVDRLIEPDGGAHVRKGAVDIHCRFPFPAPQHGGQHGAGHRPLGSESAHTGAGHQVMAVAVRDCFVIPVGSIYIHETRRVRSGRRKVQFHAGIGAGTAVIPDGHQLIVLGYGLRGLQIAVRGGGDRLFRIDEPAFQRGARLCDHRKRIIGISGTVDIDIGIGHRSAVGIHEKPFVVRRHPPSGDRVGPVNEHLRFQDPAAYQPYHGGLIGGTVAESCKCIDDLQIVVVADPVGQIPSYVTVLPGRRSHVVGKRAQCIELILRYGHIMFRQEAGHFRNGGLCHIILQILLCFLLRDRTAGILGLIPQHSVADVVFSLIQVFFRLE